ncbi:hypothetical protein N7499_001730 [Penicillium canescens]|uniref:WHIM1 domain-containing protein n=1 Tax=Penicillium canescens TaxID=5083 RepID=A0AAD6N5J9_PENCN|nr:uncharacterized protein N7446_009274 [Penicillium canescens]KAJ6034525.1 hypothetical protein N7460_008700 [Penicillium canescens]KAJ6053262.1 hypothetical protein N7446_009274 [Penicillium canescens]KAJ6097356.1 hypothetical protein N7499_001730 [Penicillium canescens]KAJ6165347.1 hypothetical protein N7485_008591 [Penicillium canescens]
MPPSDSEVSSLSSAPPTDDEAAMAIDEPVGIAKYFKKESETPPPKREPSPPHEYVLADNPDIAFIVTFRARFHEVFPRGLPHYGPQDIETGVQESPPGEYIERLLCALLGLVLNRKKDVERAHFTRPLEEAIHTHQSQWPKAWGGKNPLHGGRSFATMTPEERIQLLKALILWSLSSSEAVQAKIKESYKQSRHDDDLNQPLSVQSWGRDSLKRRYWLIEGQEDTHFRLYRESNPVLKHNTWWSIAGDIPELEAVAAKLEGEKGTNSKKLSEKIRASIPRFEASEEKRKRRDYRLARKAAFTRPDPGFSMYEGRTRGKKLKYTYDDEDMFSEDETSVRRSTRGAGTTAASTESSRPRFTASGRQIRSRAGGLYGETLLAGQNDGANEEEDDEEEEISRPQRTRTSRNPNGYSGYDAEDLEDASIHSSANESGNEWRGPEDDEEHDFEGDNEDEEEEASEEDSDVSEEPESLVVQLRYGRGDAPSNGNIEIQNDEPPPAKDVQMKDATDTAAAPSTQASTMPHPPLLSENRAPEAASSLPSVPVPQVPTQPAPVSAPLPISKPQEATLHEPIATASPFPASPLAAHPEAPKANQHTESNGASRP